jgi:hypothetical protein
MKQGDALSPLLSNCALEYTIRVFQKKSGSFKLNEICQLLNYTDVNLLGEKIYHKEKLRSSIRC